MRTDDDNNDENSRHIHTLHHKATSPKLTEVPDLPLAFGCCWALAPNRSSEQQILHEKDTNLSIVMNEAFYYSVVAQAIKQVKILLSSRKKNKFNTYHHYHHLE